MQRECADHCRNPGLYFNKGDEARFANDEGLLILNGVLGGSNARVVRRVNGSVAMAINGVVREDRLLVTVEGRFNFEAHGAFNAATAELGQNPDIRAIEINVFDVNYIDSSALGMLLVLRDDAKKRGITDLAIVGSRGAIRQVLDIAKFEKFYALR